MTQKTVKRQLPLTWEQPGANTVQLDGPLRSEVLELLGQLLVEAVASSRTATSDGGDDEREDHP